MCLFVRSRLTTFLSGINKSQNQAVSFSRGLSLHLRSCVCFLDSRVGLECAGCQSLVCRQVVFFQCELGDVWVVNLLRLEKPYWAEYVSVKSSTRMIILPK